MHIKSLFRKPIKSHAPHRPTAGCPACRSWEAKYNTLEAQYQNLQEENRALREECRSLLMSERRPSWRANWIF